MQKHKLYGIIILLILSLWSVTSLFSTGFFPMHDDTQVARVVVMGDALREGQFPVRWVKELGYGLGYPIYNFYAPLPYYAGGALYVLGVDSLIATKSMFAIGLILSSVTMYFLLYPAVGLLGALFGSVLFLYAPYHAVQAYIRGSVGEYWAIAFIPIVLLGIIDAYRSKSPSRGVILSSIGMAGIILSHTILGFVSTLLFIAGWFMFIVYAFLINPQPFNRIIIPLYVLVLGLFMSAFFWLPAYLELGYTSVSTMITTAPTVFTDHFVCPAQLWNSSWGYAGSAPGCLYDGISFKLGKFHVVISVTAFVLLLMTYVMRKRRPGVFLFFAGLALLVISVFGMLPVSLEFWNIFPFTSYIQYPWRLLSFCIVAMALIGAYLNRLIYPIFLRRLIMVFLIISCIGINAKLFKPQFTYPRDSIAFESKEDIGYRVSKISDEYLPSGVQKPKDLSEIKSNVVESDENTRVHIVKNTATYLLAKVDSNTDTFVVINTVHFPGWRYFVNSIEIVPTFHNQLPSIPIMPGKTIIEARFENTRVRSIGNILSIFAILVIGGLLYYESKTNR